MELRVLSYFLAVAREENITKAAQMLHLTQPTLSRQIAQLEAELGVKLFHRSNHNIILTEDGMLLKRRAQELLSLAEKTKSDFLQKEEALAGEIAIGSGEFQSTRILAQIMESFQERHPMVRYRLYSGNADNIRDHIERGLLDMGLMTEPVDIRKYEFAPMPVKETWGLLVRTDSELAHKDVIAPTDCAGLSLIASSNEFAESNLGRWFGEHYRELNIIAVGNLLYNEAMLAESGMGAVLCIRLNCTYENLKFIPFSPGLELGTVLAWKKEQLFSPAATAFLHHAKKCVQSISGDNN